MDGEVKQSKACPTVKLAPSKSNHTAEFLKVLSA